MIDHRLLRKQRLEQEYLELMSLNSPGSPIKVEPLGSAPYEKYRITYNIRTIVRGSHPQIP